MTLLSFSCPVRALAATESVDITATIVPSVSLTVSQPLSFGSIVIGSGAGSLTLDPVGAVSSTGNVTSTGVQSPAMVTITAEPGMQLLTSTDSSVTLYSGSDTMIVNNFQISDGTVGVPKIMTLNFPSEDVTIGATLQIGANQPPGDYTGTFTYTVDYQ